MIVTFNTFFNSDYNLRQNIWNKIKKSGRRLEKFDTYFCVFFYCYCQSSTNREATRIPSLLYEILSFILFVANLAVLKICNVPKPYDQDCRLILQQENFRYPRINFSYNFISQADTSSPKNFSVFQRSQTSF